MRNLFSGKRDAFEIALRFIWGQASLLLICGEAILRIVNRLSRGSKCLPQTEMCPHLGQNGPTQGGFRGVRGAGRGSGVGRDLQSPARVAVSVKEKAPVLTVAGHVFHTVYSGFRKGKAESAPGSGAEEDRILRLQEGGRGLQLRPRGGGLGPPKTLKDRVASSVPGPGLWPSDS